MRTCRKCLAEKADADFYNWLPNTCKACDNKRQQALRAGYKLNGPAKPRDKVNKVCAACKQLLPRTEFPQNKKTGYQLGYCNPCEKQRIAVKRIRNLTIINDHLRANPCVTCGRSDIRVLDFNHRKELGAKKWNICHGTGMSEEALRSEIAKCEVLCANCHRLFTMKSQSHGPWRKPVNELAELGTEKWHRITRTRVKADRIKSLLDGKSCEACGESNTWVLEWAHRAGTEKLDDVSQMTTCKWSRVLLEVAKCRPLCVCCHRIETYTENGSTSRDVA